MRSLFSRALVLFVSSMLSCACVAGQDVPVGRGVAAGRLWVAIKYFHPWLAYRGIDWDAAWVQAYPAIKAADDSQAYQKAVDGLLAQLHDPITKVIRQPSPAPDDSGAIQTKWEADSVLTITIPNSSDWAGMSEKLRNASSDIKKARAIVFDLRAGSDLTEYALSASAVDRLLTNQTISAPGERRRFHSGLPSESSTSGGYYSGFQGRAGIRFVPSDVAGEKRCAFLVSQRTTIPGIALALQAEGKAAIVSEGDITDENLVTTAMVQLSDGLQVKIRLGELLYADGTTGIVPDIVVREGGMKAALAAVSQAYSRPAGRTRVPVVPSQHPAQPYPEASYPGAAYRALAALQIWAAHNYFYPYKGLMGEDWNGVLNEFMPKLEAAKDEREYHLGVAQMLTHVHDTHSGARSKVLKQFFGEADSSLRLRWIDNSPVVTQLLDKDWAATAGIAPGDVLLKIEGQDVNVRIRELSMYLSASTPQALMWKVCGRLLSGAPGSQATVEVRKPDGSSRTATVPRKTEYGTQPIQPPGGDVVRFLQEDIGYADLNRLTVPMVDEMFDKFRNSRAIIFDMRGYPQGTAWSIAPRLTEARSPIAAMFSRPVAMVPDPAPGESFETTTYSFTQPIPATDKWRYKGQTVMLIDERTLSQAEHTGLFFEAANRTKFVGTPTSGANGDVTEFSVPGGIRISMTGHDVRHANGKQLQRVGLQPDVNIAPTIAGIAAGQDEVLNRAVEFVKNGK